MGAGILLGVGVAFLAEEHIRGALELSPELASYSEISVKTRLAREMYDKAYARAGLAPGISPQRRDRAPVG